VLLVGAGAVGRRTARQLAETDGIGRVLVVDQDHKTAQEVAEAIGDPVEALPWTPAGDLPDGVDVVAVAAEGLIEPSVAERAIEARIPAAFCADDPRTITALLGLSGSAESAGVSLAAGCGLAPGLSDVLARHAADALEEVSEMLVARCGSSGPACRDGGGQRHADHLDEWRGGAWVRERTGTGRSLVWFPDPVGGQDCRRSPSGQVALLVDAFPGLQRASMRLASEPANPTGRRRGRPDPDGEWGAVWVEVRGRRARSQELVVYGAVDRIAFAAAAVLATATAGLVGAGTAAPARAGVHGLGALFDPVPFLAELARRGVQAATFEGARF
jgi:hypothetical protein